jgi:hypothetical protein
MKTTWICQPSLQADQKTHYVQQASYMWKHLLHKFLEANFRLSRFFGGWLDLNLCQYIQNTKYQFPNLQKITKNRSNLYAAENNTYAQANINMLWPSYEQNQNSDISPKLIISDFQNILQLW